jgi:hypothetical protein
LRTPTSLTAAGRDKASTVRSSEMSACTDTGLGDYLAFAEGGEQDEPSLDWGSPSQQPSFRRQRGHCQVPCRHSIVAAQRTQRSTASVRASTRRRLAAGPDG